ncbi:unnamed protein product, partial [Aphanomyces euteiches]
GPGNYANHIGPELPVLTHDSGGHYSPLQIANFEVPALEYAPPGGPTSDEDYSLHVVGTALGPMT